MSTFDPQIMQEFLTESGELVAQLEGDLVTLEHQPRDPAMLNQVFRALHTIKGSASFLSLGNLVKVAHAAESALNAARNGAAQVDRSAMDLLLEAVDLIKNHLSQVEGGEELAEPRPALVAGLSAIGEGKQAAGATAAAPQAAQAPAAAAKAEAQYPTRPLELSGGKADLFEFLVADLDETLKKTRDACAALPSGGDVQALTDTCEQLARTVDFFDFTEMTAFARALARAAEGLPNVTAELRGQVWPRMLAACEVMLHQAEGVRQRELRALPAGRLLERLAAIIEKNDLEAGAQLRANATWADAARLDGAWAPPAAEGSPAAEPEKEQGAPALQLVGAPEGEQPMKGENSPAAQQGADGAHKKGAGENTIRVEVGRLEALMNLVGELVLQKNRVAALARRVSSHEQPELAEQFTLAAGGLDRVTSDIQMAVMRTRMQPLDKLFGRYPRLIRDLASKTGKQIRLAVEGGGTEVDKSVIEELGDPLVHLLRNAADHGLETPEERRAAGKPDEAVITLRASHEGSHVRVLVIDDGRGLSRERIGRKAVERGMVTQEQLATLEDREVFKFIFEAGFSTAEQVSDLSGRGVGMDVVRTNIQKLKGSIELFSEAGKGTTVAITIPLTVAILPAMLVGVGDEIYTVPLSSILEIVRPEPALVHSIGGGRIMRLRDTILPLVSAAELFELNTAETTVAEPFAVVLSMDGRSVGLLVTRLIGQQEVVIKPLDDLGAQKRRGVSGATVRDDGGVSLIVDVAELIKSAQAPHARAAA